MTTTTGAQGVAAGGLLGDEEAGASVRPQVLGVHGERADEEERTPAVVQGVGHDRAEREPGPADGVRRQRADADERAGTLRVRGLGDLGLLAMAGDDVVAPGTLHDAYDSTRLGQGSGVT